MNKLLITFCVVLVGCNVPEEKPILEDDNIIEESAEYMIKRYMGIDIDLTPESKE